MRYRVFWGGWWKCSKIRQLWLLCTSVNILKARIVYIKRMNFIVCNLYCNSFVIKKKEHTEDQSMRSLVLLKMPIFSLTFWFICLHTGVNFGKWDRLKVVCPWDGAGRCLQKHTGIADYSCLKNVGKPVWSSRNMWIYRNPCFQLLFYNRIMHKEYLIFNAFSSENSKGPDKWKDKQTLKML